MTAPTERYATDAPVRDVPTTHLRLYVARSTPNSVRAQHNLAIALETLGDMLPPLEIIDVFSQPRRAVVDGVVTTPTLIGTGAGRRLIVMGDLADHDQLRRKLLDFSRNNALADR